MASSITNAINSKLRLSGMSSGLDTETMIKQLMKVESAKLDKVKQSKQLLEWKRDNYRDMTNLIRAFKDDYFDVTKPTSNMRSSANYRVFSATSSNTGVTATANSTAAIGTHTITVTQLATAASASSSAEVNAPLQSYSDITDLNLSGKDFNVTLNGVTRNIKFSENYGSVADLGTALQTKLDNVFGTNNITVGVTGNKLVFCGNTNRMVLSSGTTDALAQMNLVNGSTNRLDMTQDLADIGFDTPLTGTVSFKINNVSFSFDTANNSMEDVMSEINSSAANVTMAYSEATGKFSLTSKTLGAGEAITIENTSGSFFGASSATKIGTNPINNGKDAIFNLDTTNGIHRNSNNFTIDGISYNLTSEVSSTISVTQDVNAVYDKIKSFVDKYNDVLAKLNTEVSEKYNRDYQPLTDDQKESMSEDDVKKWEEKAKTGLLRNDNILNNMINNMRKTLSDAVAGVSGTLSSIGISTSTYTDKGKLTIDEAKLKQAIKDTPDKVMNLFSKESSIAYSPNLTNDQKAKRYNENGFVNRLYDIIQDNTRTIRDSDGRKGILLEKAGVTGDVSEFNNLLYKEIDEKQTSINSLIDKLQDKEDYYYKKFTAMESALSKMNSQSSWLSQQFGGSSS